MSSYQDIETRLRVVEAKLDFIMNSLRMKAAKPNGLVNPDGTPSYTTFDGSLLELYHLSNQLPVVNQDDDYPVNPPTES